MSATDWYRWQGEDLVLMIRVQARASSDRFGEPGSDGLRLRITAPPVDGKANNHLLRFLARAFGVTQKQVELLSGKASRSKRFIIRSPRRFPEGVHLGRPETGSKRQK